MCLHPWSLQPACTAQARVHATLGACTRPPALLLQARGARTRRRLPGRLRGLRAGWRCVQRRRATECPAWPCSRAGARTVSVGAATPSAGPRACRVGASRRPARPPRAAGRARPPERSGCFLTESCRRAGYFLTKIFHPNVAKGGEICVNVLKRDWARDLGLRHVLLVVRCLLVEPFPESALNEEAGKLLLESYAAYAAHAALLTSIHAQPAKRCAARSVVNSSLNSSLLIPPQQCAQAVS